MTKDEAKKMENSQLLCELFIARDNLVIIKRNLNDNEFKENSRVKQELEDLFEIEERQYTELLNEVYRRMNYGRKKR